MSASPPAQGLPDSVGNQFSSRSPRKSWHPLLQLAPPRSADRLVAVAVAVLVVERARQHRLWPTVAWSRSSAFFLSERSPCGARARPIMTLSIGKSMSRSRTRTKSRPIPSGRIGVRAALLFLAAQCLVGLCVLLSFNGFTIWLGFASLGIVCLYPFVKRFSSWPQAVLGAAFAWGGLVGWAAAFGSLACSHRALSWRSVLDDWLRHDLRGAGCRG